MTQDYMSFSDVQQALDSIVEGQSFVVTFEKANGETVTYNGTLDVGANRSQSVAIYTAEGWKRFNVNRVVAITL